MKKEDKPFYKQGWFGGIILIVLVAIPFIINYAYLIGSPDGQPNTVFSPSDMILFYGSILSLSGTVFLGIIAYKQNENANNLTRELNESNIKMSILPSVVINPVNAKYSGSIFLALIESVIKNIEKNTDINDEDMVEVKEENLISYEENEITDFYFFFRSEKLDFNHKLSKIQENKIYEKYKTSSGKLEVSDTFYFPYKLLSVGSGDAINVTLRLYKKGYLGSEKYDVHSCPLSFKKNFGYNLGFYFDNKPEFNEEYCLYIQYYDVLGHKYAQTHSINFMENDKNEMYIKFNVEVIREEK